MESITGNVSQANEDAREPFGMAGELTRNLRVTAVKPIRK
jgi:hypothetical protein